MEHGLYVKADSNGAKMIVCLYVDDLLITGSSQTEINNFKEQMEKEFEMTYISGNWLISLEWSSLIQRLDC